MRRVVWTEEAASNLESITRYIADFSPLAAQRVGVRLKLAGDSLETYPFRGRAVGGTLREWVVVRPFIMRYRVTEDRVLILRIRHGARRPS